MRLTADGVTPVERLVLVNRLTDDEGYTLALAEPLFLAPGDRVLVEHDAVTVTRAGGAVFSPAASAEWRCLGRGRVRD
ncbi:hypothetical protein [Yinghuangia seranimata]|uniref:hypothetical protein n=1 Tax=Yinghuangia seranimata TaxID=408067 RepID=UPI00248CDA1D|nr:hypothetical protein [Yinghuangia seranimata]MDI2127745.1 hypothetical protein [Yinghuangia seranimata]